MDTLKELFQYGKEMLKKAQIPEWQNDAWELLEYVFGIEKSYYFLHENDKINKSKQSEYEKVIHMRFQRIPLQHILGYTWFMGYKFYVNDKVLIPRYDTEILVDEVGRLLKEKMRILDVCTGSGCILLSLLKAYQHLHIEGTGVDISAEALQVAEKNRQRLDVCAQLIESDLFSKVQGSYDMIVSNPPYIATKELDTLMPEVRDHEPWLALDGKEDGLYFYRKIIEQADTYLNSGGWLCFEIGYDQGEELRELLVQNGYENVHIGQDLAGLDRTAFGMKK